MERRRDDATCMCHRERLTTVGKTGGSGHHFHDALRGTGIECSSRHHRGRLVDGQPEDGGRTVYHLIERLTILLSGAICSC